MSIEGSMRKTGLIDSMIEINMENRIKQQNEFNERQKICRAIADSRMFGRKIDDPKNLDSHVMSWEIHDLISKIPNRIGVVSF